MCRSASPSRGRSNCQPGNGSRQANHLNGTCHPVLCCSSFCHICLVTVPSSVTLGCILYMQVWKTLIYFFFYFWKTQFMLWPKLPHNIRTYTCRLSIGLHTGRRERCHNLAVDGGGRGGQWYQNNSACMPWVSQPQSWLFFFKQIFICVFSTWPVNQALEGSRHGFQQGGSEQILSSSLCITLSQVS